MHRPIQTPSPSLLTVNGIKRVSISQVERQEPPFSPNDFVPLPENTLAFANITSAINLGLLILESPHGRAVLNDLGTRLLQEALDPRHPCFGNQRNRMSHYVAKFLTSMREDLPIVTIRPLPPGTIAASNREGNLWNGDLDNYSPKDHGALMFDLWKSNLMARSSALADAQPSTKQGRAQRQKLLLRHKVYLFMFGVGAAHELCHLFVGYMRGNGRYGRVGTPPEIDHLTYGPEQSDDNGESGRWVENKLYGGALEYYCNPADDDDQAGIPHILDTRNVAWPVDINAILGFVEDPRRFRFPLTTSGRGITSEQRAARGISGPGYLEKLTALDRNQSMMLFVRPQRINHRFFSVSKEELDRVRREPSRIRAVRVR